jgi:four helix bundle protein
MKEIRNPKSEGRRKAEIRNPKFERDDAALTSESVFRSWAEQSEEHALVLKEDARGIGSPPALDERTMRFGEAIIGFAKRIPRNPVNERLISQLVGAGTSIGANFCEADDSVSGKEFKLRIGTCRKESKETMFFLRLIATAEPTLADEARTLWREAKQLNLIFGAIWRKR